MKNKHKTGIALMAFVALVCSCKKDFLEVTPKGRLIAQKVADYDLLLNNLDLSNISTSSQVIMSDEIAAVQPYFDGSDQRTQRLFRWEDVIYQRDQDAIEMDMPMRNIYTYNKIINELPAATDGTEQQKQSIAAEAMAGRAWTYFLLVNYFAKPYSSGTAATDPGYPIITKADVTETKFTRATVQEVYDFIVDDLVKAIPHLPARTTHSLRMSQAAAEGLLGKVYLFMGKPDLALPHLNASLLAVNNSAIPIALYDYNKTLAPGGEFLPMGIYGPNYPNTANNREILYNKQSSNFWTFIYNELVIDKPTVALFDPADLRLKFYSASAYYGPAYPTGLLRKMGPTTFQYGVVLPDLYLLRAESKARMGDLAGARLDVEALRKNRMPEANALVPASIAGQQLALLKFILSERVREFAVSGYRWFDMRRLSVDPLFSDTHYAHRLYNETGEVMATYDLKPERMVLRFPQKVMDQSPGMQNNP
ncbi:RagB/SusD family nutrient uptake outer membrane protein [Sphingobacterium spiritivorum]|uniref:RagB/SusD family nutrient uptake outer membrane protein n=1 Tax=Sphingobacterium spiritivorum TaxID=258 RepID=UPI003DA53BE2